MEKKVKFVCKKCPDCCIFSSEEETPIVFYWEKEQLEKIASKKEKSLHFKKLLVVFDGEDEFVYIYRWAISGRCPFLNDNLCMIHKEKPIACKMYPLGIQIPENRLYISGKCRWVQENKDQINVEDLHNIFSEFELALKVMIMLKNFFDEAKKRGWTIKVIRP
ncbi:MAG: YkgJ family cysteine cluster protein [Candidatus Njordarchaeota archaeon]